MGDVEFERLDSEQAVAQRDTVESVYRGSYVDAIRDGGEFNTVESFMRRFDAYRTNPSLDLVVARVGGTAVGQSWGWPLGPASRWWEGIDAEPEPGFTEEDGHRTFALSEIMVVRQHAGQGLARRLHDHLLGGRIERRATLLVRAGNARAYQAYLRWGWSRQASLTPSWDDAPTFDVLIRDLTSP
jgi:GNAT superfamily N-acetyltransferase